VVHEWVVIPLVGYDGQLSQFEYVERAMGGFLERSLGCGSTYPDCRFDGLVVSGDNV
jgi:hypothetical protein